MDWWLCGCVLVIGENLLGSNSGARLGLGLGLGFLVGCLSSLLFVSMLQGLLVHNFEPL